MCESTVFIVRDGKKEELMKDVVHIHFEKEKIVCVDILGDKKEVMNAAIKEANLVEHAIILEKR